MRVATLVVLVLLAGRASGRDVEAERDRRGEDREGIELFERSIRPVLVGRCSECHGAGVKAPKGGLALDTPLGILKGGDSGPAIVPGDPEASLLIQAIRYADDELKMPPKRRL